jgi:hypothetical protein
MEIQTSAFIDCFYGISATISVAILQPIQPRFCSDYCRVSAAISAAIYVAISVAISAAITATISAAAISATFLQ